MWKVFLLGVAFTIVTSIVWVSILNKENNIEDENQ